MKNWRSHIWNITWKQDQRKLKLLPSIMQSHRICMKWYIECNTVNRCVRVHVCAVWYAYWPLSPVRSLANWLHSNSNLISHSAAFAYYANTQFDHHHHCPIASRAEPIVWHENALRLVWSIVGERKAICKGDPKLNKTIRNNFPIVLHFNSSPPPPPPSMLCERAQTPKPSQKSMNFLHNANAQSICDAMAERRSSCNTQLSKLDNLIFLNGLGYN